MADIVERLRAYAGDDHERGCQGRYYDCSCGYDDKRDPLLTQAADEIERLRAALAQVEGCLSLANDRVTAYLYTVGSISSGLLPIVRAALEAGNE